VTATATETRRRLPGARPLRDGHALYWWGELIAIVVYYAVYSAIRNHSDASPAHAFRNAERIIDAEKWLRLYHEQPLNHWAASARPIAIICNYFYGSLHFVVTIGAGIYLFRRFTDDYPRWRNTLAVSTGLALIGFYSFPLMPPRLLDDFALHNLGLHHAFGYVDTLARDPTIWSFNSGAVSKISNQFAAMPSVHCCWALWCACVLVPRLTAPWAKALAAAYPAMTVTVIVLTANHYFLDAVGGFTALGVGYLVAHRLTRAGRPNGSRPHRESRALA
jgi:PAP2 superfamily